MPYIHTREKTTRIRQILTQHIKRHVHDDNEPTHLSLSLPPSSLSPTGTSLATEGLYKQYIQALNAHHKARERYDAVKDETDQLLRIDSEQSHNLQQTNTTNSNTVRDYADLLRQRRQQRKLEAVQDALTKLLNTEPNPAQVDIKVSVKEALGEPPQPPVATYEGNADTDASVNDLTFQLKKELLIAKNKFSAAKNAKIEAESKARSGGDVDAQEKLSILRDARDELISWVEGELAKIPEDEVEASQVEISFLGDEDGEASGGYSLLSNEELSRRVDELYNRYLTSRQRYITNVEATLEQAPKLETATKPEVGAQSLSPQISTLSTPVTKPGLIQASQLLPYLTRITSTTRDEALLQQQSSHLRQQLTLATEETNNIVQRLASESLLVPSISTSVSAWAKSAAEAGDKTKQTVLGNVIDGEASIANAKKVLDGLRTRRQALEGLRRDL
jgi:hypothetical protein